MKTKEEIKQEILKTEKMHKSVLDLPAALIQINAPRALIQISAISKLEGLYWAIDEEMPDYKANEATF